jgi:hypothetical protein
MRGLELIEYGYNYAPCPMQTVRHCQLTQYLLTQLNADPPMPLLSHTFPLIRTRRHTLHILNRSPSRCIQGFGVQCTMGAKHKVKDQCFKRVDPAQGASLSIDVLFASCAWDCTLAIRFACGRAVQLSPAHFTAHLDLHLTFSQRSRRAASWCYG